MSAVIEPEIRFRTPSHLWLLLGLAALAVGVVFWEPIVRLVNNWVSRDEYSHGLVIPLISAYLIWQRRDALAAIKFTGSWLGLAVVVLGLGIWLAGELATIFAVTQFALVVVIAGVALAWVGAKGFRYLFTPILMLLLAIPLPRFLYNNFSSEMQLLSSKLGVAVMRLFDISVYLEGNVIDLGHFQMQVVEACDGLRYLFPMMALALIIAYFFRGPVWARALVFLISIPLTIAMNSLRIAMIGIFAEYGNTALAEGLLHDMQGWAMFMISTAMLLGVVWILWRFRNPSVPFANAFNLGPIPGQPSEGELQNRRPPATFVIALVLLAAMTGTAIALPERAEITPAREFCITFPMQFDDLAGKQSRLEPHFLDELKVDDYLLANYRSPGNLPINLFLAYYGSQRKGQSVHSPRSCLPGGGWKIKEFGTYQLDGQPGKRVNRALVTMGNESQLVYYWFKQRERWLTNEYAVKWYIFLDSLQRNRSDGAMIRLVTPVPTPDRIPAADRYLTDFALKVEAELPRYVPD
ncbi:MAG: VPLPA-CTERM-specific exosortase XrtD [Pseudomonadota bacterium]